MGDSARTTVDSFKRQPTRDRVGVVTVWLPPQRSKPPIWPFFLPKDVTCPWMFVPNCSTPP